MSAPEIKKGLAGRGQAAAGLFAPIAPVRLTAGPELAEVLRWLLRTRGLKRTGWDSNPLRYPEGHTGFRNRHLRYFALQGEGSPCNPLADRARTDRVGFEPTIPRRAYRFSRPAHSAALPPVRPENAFSLSSAWSSIATGRLSTPPDDNGATSIRQADGSVPVSKTGMPSVGSCAQGV